MQLDRPHQATGPNIVEGKTGVSGDPTIDQWFDADCLLARPETTATYGNIGRNTRAGPSIFNIDLSLVKNTKIGRSTPSSASRPSTSSTTRSSVSPTAQFGNAAFGTITASATPSCADLRDLGAADPVRDEAAVLGRNAFAAPGSSSSREPPRLVGMAARLRGSAADLVATRDTERRLQWPSTRPLLTGLPAVEPGAAAHARRAGTSSTRASSSSGRPPGAVTGAPLAAWSRGGLSAGARAVRSPSSSTAWPTRASCRSSTRCMPVALVVVGPSLMLGLFTRGGRLGAPCSCSPSSIWRHSHRGRPPAGRGRRLPAREQEPRSRRRRCWCCSPSAPAASPASTCCGSAAPRRRSRPLRRGPLMNLTPEQEELGRRNFLRRPRGHARARGPGGGRRHSRAPCAAAPCASDSSAWGARAARAPAEHGPRLRRGQGALRRQPRPPRQGRRGPGRGKKPARQALRRLEGDARRRRTSRRSSSPRPSGSTRT